MNLDEAVGYKFQQDKRWTDNSIPYDYAYISIALGLSYAQALGGFHSRKTPEEVYFAE